MKSRLAAPEGLIDLRGISDLHGISCDGEQLIIGAATTHTTVATSELVKKSIPALARLAGSIADPQVRNVGTIGGSVANNDPSADYPSAMLGLDATIVTNTRRIAAGEFFAGLFKTALEHGEIITRMEVPVPLSAGYAKICSRASRYAMAGSFIVRKADAVHVAITGSGQDGVFRWVEAEAKLTENFAVETLKDLIPDTNQLVTDLHGDACYRAHLVAEVTRQAVAHMGSAYIR